MNRTGQLVLLQQLARLRADRAAARLARVQGLIDTLEARATALRDAPNADFGDLPGAVVQDRWDRWRALNLAQLNTQVARLNMAAQPQREIHARETARVGVLGKIAAKR